ncbi:6-phosphofructokinase [Candidatus Parcubacteria bacterium]|nr:6-phosphofructokinase [Candidatus Parcubacteria bacterium]
MKKAMGKAAIITVGGDTPAVNASIESCRRALHDMGFRKLYGIMGGYVGLMTNTHKGNIIGTTIDPLKGGSFLSSLRDSPTPPPDVRKKMKEMSHEEREKEKAKWEAKLQGALKTIEELDLDLLIVIGGDGTMRATAEFMEELRKSRKCEVIALPRTIDNDLGTQTIHHLSDKNKIMVPVCPGYPSAARNVAILVRRVRTTAESTHRIFVVEVMGRDAGWLTLATRWGWAEIQLIPEVNYVTNQEINEKNKEEAKKEERPIPSFEIPMQKVFERVEKEYTLNDPPNLIVVVCEGTFIDGAQIKKTAYGERKLTGIGDFLAELITQYLERGKLDRHLILNVEHKQEITLRPEVRCQHGDYEPRIGPPSRYDLLLAEVLAYYGLQEMIKEGIFGCLPTLKEVVSLQELKEAIEAREAQRLISFIQIENAKFQPVPVKTYYDFETLTTTPDFDDFVAKILGGEPEFKLSRSL